VACHGRHHPNPRSRPLIPRSIRTTRPPEHGEPIGTQHTAVWGEGPSGHEAVRIRAKLSYGEKFPSSRGLIHLTSPPSAFCARYRASGTGIRVPSSGDGGFRWRRTRASATAETATAAMAGVAVGARREDEQ
jgi:hypothetical protein